MDAVGRSHNREPRHVACPPDFDPQACPILAEHYFGIVPPHIRDLRFRRNCERLHRLGPRAMFEYLVDVGAARNILTFLENRIADFANLDPDVLAALGADKLPPSPLHRLKP